MNDIILHTIGKKDWVKGDIPKEIRIESGDWTQYRCNYQPQKFAFDTNECAQLSSINSCETQCNFLKATGKFSDEAIKWFTDNGYFDENGLFDFSERFTAILAGCSIKGSSQWWAWQAIDKYGLLPWKDFNYTMEESEKFDTQEDMCKDYYDPNKITQAMKDRALQSKKYLEFMYEWIINAGKPEDGLKDDLQHAPIGLGVPICSSSDWNSGEPAACNLDIAHHAVMLYKIDQDNNKIIWDHYNPAKKILPPDYKIYLAVKGIVTPTPVTKFKHIFYLDMQRGDANIEVANLQTALIELGYHIPSIENGTAMKGYYGVETQRAVFEFQRECVATNVWAWIVVWNSLGRYCSSMTRAALNKFFA